MKHDPSKHCAEPHSFWRSRHGLGLLVVGSIALYFLLTEHRAHFFSALPFLLLLACPLMHVFMHRGNGHGHRGRGDGPAGHDGHAQGVDAKPPPISRGPGEQS